MKALGPSCWERASDDRFGQDGKAQNELALPKDADRRGKRSRLSSEFAGDGGGAAGEVDIGDGGEVLLTYMMTVEVCMQTTTDDIP